MSIKHTTTVDIGDLRTLSKPIHLMQYDKSLPEIEVHITKDGQEYTIPSGYSATIRWGKPDKHGCTATGTVSGSTVTFQVTEQMACVAGRSKVTVEIVESDSSHAGTAKFEVIVDSNPIGDNTIVSDSEIADIQKAIEAWQNADKASETATTKANEASASATTASQKAESAITSATKAKESETNAKLSETNASNSAKEAKASADSIANVTSDVDKLKGDLNDLESDLSSVINLANPLKINKLDDGVFTITTDGQDRYYIMSPINAQRVSCDTSDMGIIVGDVIGLEDYSTYQFAIGENNTKYSWIGDGYHSSDVIITEENIIHAKGIIFKRNDNADLTSQDKENIIKLFGSKTRSNHTKIKDNKPLRNYVHISFDDIVRCFEDLATNKDTYNSIFDSEFFGGLKNLHDKYGAKFSLYCYDISSSVSTIGNKFADDFNNASDWLKFGFHLYSQGKNLAGYNAFLNDIFTLGMTFNSIDRLPRLDGFGGSLSDILAMRDADCGIIGLLTTDDSRSSYYLNDEQNAYLRTHSKLYDYENGLVMYSTNMRLDWFINGFSSNYEYNVPHESNPYDELTYRMKDRTFCNIYEPIVVFIHEWQVFTTSFTINSYFDLIEQVCKFANDYGLDFDFPYIRENFGITKSSLSVASTNGVHTKTELSFDWVMGAIDAVGGLVDSSTRIRTPIFKATKLFVEIPSGYKCNIGKYTSEDANRSTLESLTGWVTANQSLSDGYFVIAFSQNDDTASVEIGDLLKVVVIN